jgi:hypothetical protein
MGGSSSGTGGVGLEEVEEAGVVEAAAVRRRGWATATRPVAVVAVVAVVAAVAAAVASRMTRPWQTRTRHTGPRKPGLTGWTWRGRWRRGGRRSGGGSR